MAEFKIKKASLRNVKARIALDGPSGSGKTYSSLLLARGLVGKDGKICVIDSEKSRSEAYCADARIGEFDILEISPPYSPLNYIDALKMVFSSGYDIVIIDSLSHVWIGDGGVLSAVQALRGRGTNEFAIWKTPSEQFNRLINTIVASPIHIISTLRSKTAYEIVETQGGKKVPQKVGLAPQIRESTEFEFDVYFSIDPEHKATLSKCNASYSRVLTEALMVDPMISTELGQSLKNWLSAADSKKGAAVSFPVEIKTALLPVSQELQSRLGNARQAVGDEVFFQTMSEVFGPNFNITDSTTTHQQGEVLLNRLREVFAAQAPVTNPTPEKTNA